MPVTEVPVMPAGCGDICSVCQAQAYRCPDSGHFVICHAPMCFQVRDLQQTVLEFEERIKKIEARLSRGSPFA